MACACVTFWPASTIFNKAMIRAMIRMSPSEFFPFSFSLGAPSLASPLVLPASFPLTRACRVARAAVIEVNCFCTSASCLRRLVAREPPFPPPPSSGSTKCSTRNFCTTAQHRLSDGENFPQTILTFVWQCPTIAAVKDSNPFPESLYMVQTALARPATLLRSMPWLLLPRWLPPSPTSQG